MCALRAAGVILSERCNMALPYSKRTLEHSTYMLSSIVVEVTYGSILIHLHTDKVGMEFSGSTWNGVIPRRCFANVCVVQVLEIRK